MDTLINMGFHKQSARSALDWSGGNLSVALDYLLSGSVEDQTREEDRTHQHAAATDTDATDENIDGSNNTHERIVHSELSQYSLPNGRSACTCIALNAASFLLLDADMRPNKQVGEISPEVLSDCILEGVQSYQAIIEAGSSSSASIVEHMSPEEVLSKFPGTISEKIKVVSLQSGVLLSSPPSLSAPSGIYDCLANSCLRNSGVNPCFSVGVILVKPPETVLIILPPLSSDGGSFILVDSHPRPPVCAGSYAQVFPTLEDLCQKLSSIFPAVDLGPDVGEMIAMMYNSFDAYVLQVKDGDTDT